jgi:hypothetical protein
VSGQRATRRHHFMKRPKNFPKISISYRVDRRRERHPVASPNTHLRPRPMLGNDLEREGLDDDLATGSSSAARPLAILADGCTIDFANYARFFKRFPRGRCMRQQTSLDLALRQHPAAFAPRCHQQHLERRVLVSPIRNSRRLHRNHLVSCNKSDTMFYWETKSAVENNVSGDRLDAPATLHRSRATCPEEMCDTQAEQIGRGSFAKMLRLALSDPDDEVWRYSIVTQQGAIQGEELRACDANSQSREVRIATDEARAPVRNQHDLTKGRRSEVLAGRDYNAFKTGNMIPGRQAGEQLSDRAGS